MSAVEKNILKYLQDNGIKHVFVYKGIGMPKSTFYSRMSGGTELLHSEFVKICTLLGKDPNTFTEVTT